MKVARLSNVLIRDLLIILTRLSLQYDVVDVIVDLDKKTIILDPISNAVDDSELTDENIYTLV